MRATNLTVSPLVALVACCFVVGGATGFAASLELTPEKMTIFSSGNSVPLSTCTLTAAAADTYADGALLSQGSNFGTASQLHVRSDTLGAKRSFVRFDLASCAIPGGARIASASLNLHLSNAPGGSRTYQARRVTASWGETTLTWSNQPAVIASTTASVSTGTTSGVALTWEVEADVQAFANGTANQGWRIADASEGSLLAQEGRFSSAEHATAAQRPSLAIAYYP